MDWTVTTLRLYLAKVIDPAVHKSMRRIVFLLNYFSEHMRRFGVLAGMKTMMNDGWNAIRAITVMLNYR